MKNTLTHIQSHELCTYLENIAIEGKINLRPAEVAKQASRELGFEVSRPKVTRTAKALGVDLIFNIPRSNGAAGDEATLMVYDDLVERLTRMERKLNLIMAHQNIVDVT